MVIKHFSIRNKQYYTRNGVIVYPPWSSNVPNNRIKTISLEEHKKLLIIPHEDVCGYFYKLMAEGYEKVEMKETLFRTLSGVVTYEKYKKDYDNPIFYNTLFGCKVEYPYKEERTRKISEFGASIYKDYDGNYNFAGLRLILK